MTKRSNRQFATGEYYHVYNRGVDKRNIFLDKKDFERFLKSMILFNTLEPLGSLYEHEFNLRFGRRTSKTTKLPLIDIVSYALNPNHIHMVLCQMIEGGVSEFIKRVSGGYAKYFNHKYKRSGALFQGKFKSVHVSSNEYLLHVGTYVNLNDKVHRLPRHASKTSWEEYVLPQCARPLCNTSAVLDQFRSKEEYKTFAQESLRDMFERKERMRELQALLLE